MLKPPRSPRAGRNRGRLPLGERGEPLAHADASRCSRRSRRTARRPGRAPAAHTGMNSRMMRSTSSTSGSAKAPNRGNVAPRSSTALRPTRRGSTANASDPARHRVGHRPPPGRWEDHSRTVLRSATLQSRARAQPVEHLRLRPRTRNARIGHVRHPDGGLSGPPRDRVGIGFAPFVDKLPQLPQVLHAQLSPALLPAR